MAEAPGRELLTWDMAGDPDSLSPARKAPTQGLLRGRSGEQRVIGDGVLGQIGKRQTDRQTRGENGNKVL